MFIFSAFFTTCSFTLTERITYMQCMVNNVDDYSSVCTIHERETGDVDVGERE